MKLIYHIEKQDNNQFIIKDCFTNIVSKPTETQDWAQVYLLELAAKYMREQAEAAADAGVQTNEKVEVAGGNVWSSMNSLEFNEHITYVPTLLDK